MLASTTTESDTEVLPITEPAPSSSPADQTSPETVKEAAPAYSVPAEGVQVPDYLNPMITIHRGDRTLPKLIEETPARRWTGLVVALIITALFAFTLWTFWAPADGGIDQNAYLAGGRFISEHLTTKYDPPTPYAYIGRMFDKSVKGDHFYPKYPFGLPLLYAIFLWGFGKAHGFQAAFLVSPISAAMAVLGTFFFARRIAGSFAAVMAMILLATSQVMFELSLNANSHASCTAFAVWGFYLLLRWWQTDGGWKQWTYGILGGFLVGYAGLIRYSEGLLVLAVAVACLSRLRWTDWRSWIRCATPGLAWAVPIAALFIYNKLSLGEWTGYDSTNESEFGAAFTWAKFVVTWEEMLRTIHDMGLFFVLPLGVAGLAMLYRRSWQLGLMLTMWALPGVALYTSYYWSPERGLSYARFFTVFFPAFILGVAVCFNDGVLGHLGTLKPIEGGWGRKFLGSAKAIPLSLAIMAVVAIASGVGAYRSVNWLESGARGNSEDLFTQFRNKLNLATSGKELVKYVPAHSMLFAEEGGMGNSPIHYIQFIQDWDLYSLDGFSSSSARMGPGGGGGGGGRRGNGGGFNGGGFAGLFNGNGGGATNTQQTDTPNPMQPRLRDYLAEIFKDSDGQQKSTAELISLQQKAVDDEFAKGHRVFIAASDTRMSAMEASLLGTARATLKPRYTFKRIDQWRDYIPPVDPDSTTDTAGFGGGGGRRRNGGGFGGPGGGGPGGFGGPGGPGGGGPGGFGGRGGGLGGNGNQAVNWELVEVFNNK